MSWKNSNNPFVGLRPFESDEGLLFFGRQEQTTELLQRLHQYHFVAVIGNSGSGKSSLIRAGLIPRLKAGYLVDDRLNWIITTMKPGSGPLYNLSCALHEQLNLRNDNQSVADLVKKIQEEGADAILNILKPLWEKHNTNFFLLVDQFEELFRISMEQNEVEKKDEATDFVNVLLELSRQRDLPIYVVMTMRSDFIGDCAQFFGLPEAMNESQFLVPRLNRVQLKNAIEGPIALKGAAISHGLLNQLLNDTGDNQDQLPILQHALMRTWDVWKKKNTNSGLDIDDYKETGTMRLALSQHAEEAYAELSTDKQKSICEIMFKALTDSRGIRKPQQVSKIAMLAEATPGEVIEVVNVFRKSGRAFLMPPENVELNENSIIDLSHESLMRIWERLIKWAGEENTSERIYVRISEAAEAYEAGKGSLLRNPELGIALKWKEERSPNATWAASYNNLYDKAMLFLEKSKQQYKSELERQRLRLRRARIAAIFTTAIAVAALTLALYAFKLKSDAKEQTEEAQRQRKFALDQQTRAEFNAKEAKQNEKKAQEQRKRADEERQRADAATEQAEKERINAEKGKQEALHQKDTAVAYAEEAQIQKVNAEISAEEAKMQQKRAEEQTNKANEQEKISTKLKNLAVSRNMANESILLLNEKNEKSLDSSKTKALKAYQINQDNGGPAQNNDIYNALNIIWTKSIDNKNQSDIHQYPVRCITGPPNGNSIFTADENGVIYEFAITENGLEKIKSYSIKEEVRALAASPDGTKLVAITASGKGLILTVSSNISVSMRFEFPGIGKLVLFKDNDDFILLSNKGIGRYHMNNAIKAEPFLYNDRINAISITKSGIIYIGIGNEIRVYDNLRNLTNNMSSATVQTFRSQVTSMALDADEQYLAVGTYKGSVWIKYLKSNSNFWSSPIHSTRVNDIKFAKVEHDKIQLAAAGADQTIKLIDVRSELQNQNQEDIITLKGHSKWVYGLYYTPDGHFLCSCSEDTKVIVWKPTMEDLYKALRH
jgi:WD40 repeat protein